MKRFLVIIVLSMTQLSMFGQIRPFKSLRYEEDYRYLAADSSKDWYKRLKYSNISRKHNTYLSVGGEVRYQYFYFKNENWGDAPYDKDGFVLTRYLFHTDIHRGERFRVFAQLQSSLINGKTLSSPVQQNELEMHQAFVDYNARIAKGSWVLRAGRQELSYGSQRLVSVRELPNNRQSFDGLRSYWKDDHNQLDLLYTNYVGAKKGIFNDGVSGNVKLWGIYLTRYQIPLLRNIDLYYLGLRRRWAAFDDGNGSELRHSIGSRIWSNKQDFQYDLEAVYQWGSFAQKRIRAWTASVNLSYRFSELALKPQVGVKTEIISGDKQYSDDRLNTFNPLFPRGAYFGLAALLGPSNLMDFHPYLELYITNKLQWQADYDMFWRKSGQDGVYGPNVTLIYSGVGATAKHIGQQLGSTIIYASSQFLNMRAEFTWFNTGAYLKQVGAGKDILMTGATIQLKF